jgi:hypothetical protein
LAGWSWWKSVATRDWSGGILLGGCDRGGGGGVQGDAQRWQVEMAVDAAELLSVSNLSAHRPATPRAAGRHLDSSMPTSWDDVVRSMGLESCVGAALASHGRDLHLSVKAAAHVHGRWRAAAGQHL